MTNIEEQSFATRQVKGFKKKIEVVRLVPLGGDAHGSGSSRY
jgi:hypothetical protein